jgi:nicotinamide mononucleotide transporter
MMEWSEWSALLKEQLGQTDVIGWSVLILGVAQVLLARANNIWLYPAGIAGTSLAAFSLYDAGLYAECLLHLYYFVMSFYGWWLWSNRKPGGAIRISHTTTREWIITLVIIVGGWSGLAFALTTFTDSTVPYWDAWVSSTAWAGTWLLARRKIENWIVLNVSNIFAIPLLFQKGLPLFALLTIFLFIVACMGYLDWLKLFKRSRLVPEHPDPLKAM